MIMKMFDSDPNVKAKCESGLEVPAIANFSSLTWIGCPHTSFSHPSYSGLDTSPRKSIEVRALVFNYKKDLRIQCHAPSSYQEEIDE